MHLFHLTEASRWEAAKAAGAYAWSTRGRSLEEEGLIHAAREDQWQEVRRRYYSDVTEPLVLLVIDSEKLTSPWAEEPVGDETFPHIHGPLNLGAVVTAVPLDGADVTSPAAERPAPTGAPGPAAPTAGGTARRGPADPGPHKPFAHLFVIEVAFRAALGLMIMIVTVLAAGAGGALLPDGGEPIGALVGLAVSCVAAWAIARRRDRRAGGSPGGGRG